MLTKEKADALQALARSITQYAEKELISRRDDWGPINFEDARIDIDLALSIGRDLCELPVEFLTQRVADQLSSEIPSVADCLGEIDTFEIRGGGDPDDNRDTLCSNLHEAVERLQDIAGAGIPYFAYQRGDISENMKQLEGVIDKAKQAHNDAESWVKEKRKAVESIVRATQEAAASGGVATFTQEFESEAKDLKSRSIWWLGAAAFFGALTIAVAISFYFWFGVADEAGAWATVRNVFSKVTVIAVLFTSTVWCGRIYRALVHQATVNRHRALSLKTFQAFVQATDDDYVRDSVLMAATKAVFGAVPTGLVDESVTDEPSVNFVEFGKSANKGLSKTE